MSDADLMALRIAKLERRLRWQTLALLGIPLLTLVGWQQASETLRVRRLEVIDERGVPYVTIGAARGDEGGSIVLRDRDGEKRGWWTAAPGQSALTLNSSKPDGSNDMTIGLQVGPDNARLALISPSGALLSANMETDKPKLEMYNATGSMIFGAPWAK